MTLKKIVLNNEEKKTLEAVSARPLEGKVVIRTDPTKIPTATDDEGKKPITDPLAIDYANGASVTGGLPPNFSDNLEMVGSSEAPTKTEGSWKKWGKYILLGIAGLGGIGAAAVATSPQVKDNFKQAYNTLDDKTSKFVNNKIIPTFHPENYEDSDLDGVTDYWEMRRGTDPWEPPKTPEEIRKEKLSSTDSDGDYLDDWTEMKIGSDPHDTNTDDDPLTDFQEFVIMTDDDLLMQNKIDPTVDDKKYMVRYKDFIILAPENWTIYRQKGIEGLKVMEETFPEGYNFLDKYTEIITPVKKSYYDIAGTQSQRYTLARNGMGIIGEKNKNYPPSIRGVLHETIHLSCYTLNLTDEQVKRMKKYKASEAWDEISAYDAMYKASIAVNGPNGIKYNGNISKTIEDVFDEGSYPGHTDLTTGDIEKFRNSDIYEEINKQRGLNIFQR